MPYLVKMLNKTAEVCLMGMATELPLAYADGMIGVMPVFETREQADAFCDGKYQIVEVALVTPNVMVSGER